MNEFDYLFQVKCFEKAKSLDKQGYVPVALTPEQRQKVLILKDQINFLSCNCPAV